jgi:Tc toxin complex TcA C-terminal TcB-binding domain
MKGYAAQFGFHYIHDSHRKVRPLYTWREDTEFTYTFENFFHPFVGELIERLNKQSIPGMLDPDFHQSLATEFFSDFYTPLTSNLVKINPFPKKEIDVRGGGPYANYNWELLFHIPLTIAVHLSKNQRFAEAQRWFHYVFDPTCNDTSIPPPQRFWKFLAFRQGGDVTQIDELLALLSKPDAECTPTELQLKETILSGYEAIKNKPFQPHAVARTRHLAYQYCVVMKYLDNLIAWGDSLFRQDTMESINEATQRYVLAANLLGPHPQRIPPRGASRAKTFAQLKAQGLDPLGNALVELEGKFPFNFGLLQAEGIDPQATSPLFGMGRTLYFCIPRNEKLLGYWDTVADRLFKIRHCMNIEGVVRQLALFDPPLDPGMLVKAAAAGINIGSMVSGLNQPIGPLRCLLLIQKALELAAEVRGLGNALLSAIEKSDGEHLALLRQAHEIKIQQMQQEVRFLQWKQAQESTQSLLTTRATVLERLHCYQRILGLPVDQNAPDTLPLDRRELTEETFDEAYDALVGQYNNPLTIQNLPELKLAGDSSPASQSGASGKGQLYLNTNEDADLNVHSPLAHDSRLAAMVIEHEHAPMSFLPDMGVDLHFWGLGGHATVFGGSMLVSFGRQMSSIANMVATSEDAQAASASKTASYERRADEWMLQYNLAAHELMQIGRQILTSLIAEQIAHHEYLNIQKQIEQSQEVDRFLNEKFTNEELYLWMQGEISRLYYEYYRFAFDTARKAEQTMKRELMRPEVDATDYIKFNYWDAGRKGLLSGEALYLDVKRMEVAYHENNKREYELTKHVSIRQLNPLALLSLKATGTCEVAVPEWVFDLDNPGHYMRRIKNASLSIPSVAGPYTSISCTLSLLKSSLRKSPLGDEYARQGSEDDRFIDYFGTIQSIVTSTGNNDSGLFETNFRDERFLPFEGAGAESTWRLELPADFRQFDYNTISDVILHLRYTARQGGAQLRNTVVEHIEELIGEANQAGLALLFSLKHDFPSEWHRFSTGNANFAATVTRDHFPYFTQGKEITIDGLQVHAIQDGQLGSVTPQGLNLAAFTETLKNEGAFELSLAPVGVVLVRNKDAYVFILIKYSVGSA